MSVKYTLLTLESLKNKKDHYQNSEINTEKYVPFKVLKYSAAHAPGGVDDRATLIAIHRQIQSNTGYHFSCASYAS